MKVSRHAKIIELISQYDIETQEELAEYLNNAGFKVTQATVSRDIRDLKLSKVSTGSGHQKYILHRIEEPGMSEKYIRVLKDVGHDAQLVAAGLELVLQDQQILAAEADDAVHHTALIVQFLGNGQGNGAAHAAADHAHLLQAFHLGGTAQRAHKVVDAVAYVQAVQLHGGAADDLEDDLHGTGLAVVTGDRQGDALAVLKRAHNDKLARLCLFGDQRGFNDHLRHGGIQRDFFSDLIHCVCSFMLAFPISAHENAPVCPQRHNRRSSYRRQNDTFHYNGLQKGKQINFLRVCNDKLE